MVDVEVQATLELAECPLTTAQARAQMLELADWRPADVQARPPGPRTHHAQRDAEPWVVDVEVQAVLELADWRPAEVLAGAPGSPTHS